MSNVGYDLDTSGGLMPVSKKDNNNAYKVQIFNKLIAIVLINFKLVNMY